MRKEHLCTDGWEYKKTHRGFERGTGQTKFHLARKDWYADNNEVIPFNNAQGEAIHVVWKNPGVVRRLEYENALSLWALPWTLKYDMTETIRVRTLSFSDLSSITKIPTYEMMVGKNLRRSLPDAIRTEESKRNGEQHWEREENWKWGRRERLYKLSSGIFSRRAKINWRHLSHIWCDKKLTTLSVG